MKQKTTVLMLLLCLLTVNMVLLRVGSSEPRLKFYVDPQETTANQGDSLDVNVRIENAKDVWAFQFYLAWDPTFLEATEVAEGDFPGRGGVRETSFMKKVYNDKGYLLVSTTLVGGGAGVEGEDGEGAIAIITFSVKAAGESHLHLYQVGVMDSFERDITYTLEDGYVNVAAPKLFVEPASIIDATLVPGEVFDVNVSISNVVDLSGFRFQLGYNSTLLNATGASAPFLVEPIKPEEHVGINYTEGFVWVNVTSMGESINGSKVLANVTFSVLELGSSLLDVYDAWLNDTLARLVEPFGHNAISEDGSFTNIPVGHDIDIKKLTVLPIKAVVGDKVSINVTVQNAGAFNETFDVTLFYDSELIANQTEIRLEPGETKILQFTWDTAGVDAGSYTLKAEASVVEGETKTANNIRAFPNPVVIEASGGIDLTLYAAIGIAVVAVVLVAIIYFVKIRK